MIGRLLDVLDSGSDIESGASLFRVALRFEGLISKGGCLLGFLVKTKGLGLDEGGLSFLLVRSLGLGWLV